MNAARFRTAPTYRLVLGQTEEGIALSPAFRAVREDGRVRSDSGIDLPEGEFAASAVRCSDDGRPLVQVAAPMTAQLQVVRSATDHDLTAHLADIAALRAAAPEDPSQEPDVDVRSDLHAFDAFVAAPRDDALAGGPSRIPEGPDPVIRLIERDTGIDAGHWTSVKDMPTFQAEPLRAMARAMLRPVLGNSASLEDLRILRISTDEPERASAVRRWLKGADESREVVPFRHPAMPGYVTGTPIYAERDGVAVVTFADHAGSYVYAWQADPDRKLDIDPPDTDDVPTFRF